MSSTCPVVSPKALLRPTEAAVQSDREPAMTQGDLGEVIGMSRESTNKQLREWQERKWIKLERGGILVLQPAALRAIADRGRQTDRIDPCRSFMRRLSSDHSNRVFFRHGRPSFRRSTMIPGLGKSPRRRCPGKSPGMAKLLSRTRF